MPELRVYHSPTDHQNRDRIAPVPRPYLKQHSVLDLATLNQALPDEELLFACRQFHRQSLTVGDDRFDYERDAGERLQGDHLLHLVTENPRGEHDLARVALNIRHDA